MKCKDCRFLIKKDIEFDYCPIHDILIYDTDSECKGKRYAAVGIFKKIFKPWHPIQYAARIHDADYDVAACMSTETIDKRFYSNYLYICNAFFSKKELKIHERHAIMYYKIIRGYGKCRYLICRLKKKQTLV